MSLNQQQKDNILANLPAAIASQIEIVAQAIIDNDITWEELQNTGNFSPPLQQNLQNAIDPIKERQLWQNCESKDTIEAYRNYLSQYPNGIFKAKAERKISDKQAEQQTLQKTLQKSQLIAALKEDINSYNTTILNKNGVSYDDLIQANIQIPDSIRNIWNDAGPTLQLGTTPDSIPQGVTEIYFWGTPGSGKTCTLAAVLSTAKKNGFFGSRPSNGLMYMIQLSNLFSDTVATLPPPTPVEKTQGLSFDLSDTNQTKHPVTLVEISGEIFQCLSDACMGQPIPDDGHLSAYKSLLRFLRSTTNPKYHFFVIDVNNTQKDKYGLTQMDYLTNTAMYFNNNSIFNKSTAGINILVTKSDLLGQTQEERKNASINILRNQYLSFVNTLKDIANNHLHLIRNNDFIPVIPFTLGKIYLQNKCVFDPTMSEVVIQILQENVARAPQRTGWLNR